MGVDTQYDMKPNQARNYKQTKTEQEKINLGNYRSQFNKINDFSNLNNIFLKE